MKIELTDFTILCNAKGINKTQDELSVIFEFLEECDDSEYFSTWLSGETLPTWVATGELT